MCPICGITEEQLKKSRFKLKWCVDHDHKTKEFRGWLCDKCNMLVGVSDEKIIFFKKAIEYLEKKRGEYVS